jgi:hypothetical protein
MRNRLLSALIVSALLCGCRAGKQLPADPQPAWDETARPAAGFEDYFQSIREGMPAPGIIRGSGGCGCN